jgi:tetraacyldisaccharide 4'-kinase
MAIVARADRTVGLEALLGKAQGIRPGSERRATPPTPDCIVLDDGFQHRQIARDVDVVVIDATASRSVFADRCLPAGWLREPAESLGRASIVVLTHAELESAEWIARLKGEIARRTSAPVAVTRHVWTGLRQRADGEERMLPLDVLIGKPVVGCCAIGHPSAFAASLERVVNGPGAAMDWVGMLALPDHDPFGPARVKALAEMARVSKAAFIVVTDKDWSKLRGVPDSVWPCPVVRPELAVVFDEGREVFEGMVLRGVGPVGIGRGGT